MKIKFLCLLLLGASISFGQSKKVAAKGKRVTAAKVVSPKANPVSTHQNDTDGIFAEFETSKGKIKVQLEYKKTPITVANFISLVEGTNPMVNEKYKGKKFYDGLKFHRVIASFMIQGGDPDGNGSGGPGYAFKDEITDAKFDRPGILAMANAGPKTNGSQIFITHVPTPHLNGKHTIFGFVVGDGQSVVNAIAQDDVINKITIIRKGADALKFDAPKVFADYFANKASLDKKEAEEKLAQYKKEIEANFIANPNVAKEFANATTTESGLKYIVLQEGNGKTPVATSNVKVHYTGTFLDGKVFDSSVQRGQPIDFGLNQVIKGWTEGVQLMKEGAKYKFYIPYYLAYGEQGYPGAIPPKSDLLFEVELIKINN